MIKNIKLYKIKDKEHLVLDIKTIFGNYIFFKNISKNFLQSNSRRYFLSIIDNNNEQIVIGGISCSFYDDYKKYSVPTLIPIYELMFSNLLNEIANDMFVNSKKIIINEIDFIKNFYDEEITRIYTLNNVYQQINKLEKEFKHIKKEEVLL